MSCNCETVITQEEAAELILEEGYAAFSAEKMNLKSAKNSIQSLNIDIKNVLDIIDETSMDGYTDVYIKIPETVSALDVINMITLLQALGYTVYYVNYAKSLYISWATYPKGEDNAEAEEGSQENNSSNNGCGCNKG